MAAHMPGLKESLPGFLKMLSAAHATLAGSGIETLDLSAVFQDKTDNIFTTSPGHFN